MTEEKKNPVVDIAQLEEAFDVDLKEFEEGKTYPLPQLMGKLNLARWTPRLRSGRQPKDRFERRIMEAER